MKRLHVMLQVRDLDESVRFYQTLFAAEPTVLEGDYAKWMLEDPRVNFSIAARAAASMGSFGVEHLGIQAETPEELAELRERIALAGGKVDDQGETTCCYHQSDKTWVEDAQGVSWEAFYTSGRAATYHAPEGAGATEGCCAESCCSDGAGRDADGSDDCCAESCCASDADPAACQTGSDHGCCGQAAAG